jgi:phage-related minor tail protein
MSFIDVIQGRATLDITPFQNSLKQLQSQVNGVTTSINQGLTGVGTGAQKASSGLSALEERLNAVYRAGTQMMHVGTSFLMLGGAIQGLLVGAVEAGQAFDFWERKTEAVTEQLNAQGQVVQFATNQHNLFRQAIEGVTESVGALNPDEVAHSFYLWTSATNTTVDSLDKLNQVSGQVDVIMKAATMSGATAQQVIRGVANSMSEFGLDTDKTAYVTSVLMNVTHMTEAEMTDLIQSFKMVGPEAKVMGESLGDVAAILGVMADMGIKGTQAGRGLQRMLDGFIKPSASADSMLQGLLITNRGLQGSWRDMLYPGGQFVGLLDSTNAQGQKVDGVLHQLYEGMQKLTPEQQLLAMHTMQTENGFR